MGSSQSNYLRRVVVMTSGLMAIGLMATGMSANAAGRCGGVFAVDTTTTLTKVAQTCHVNLSALYEANPGVDPSNVRPGARLAIPSEINRYFVSETSSPLDSTYNASMTTDTDLAPARYDPPMQSSHYNLMDRDYDRTSHDTHIVYYDQAPSWMRSDISSDGNEAGERYVFRDRMSYQKQSAMRIHNAGVPELQPALMNLPTTPALKTSLIECVNLRARTGRKVHRLRKVIMEPENTFVEIVAAEDGSGADCTVISVSLNDAESRGVLPARFTSPARLSPPDYHLPDYSRIGVTPRMIKINERFSLKGEIADSYGDCLLLKTSDNRLWRLASRQNSSELLGKTVTVWGTAVTGGVCGGGASMVVSHAIYAEPWTE